MKFSSASYLLDLAAKRPALLGLNRANSWIEPYNQILGGRWICSLLKCWSAQTKWQKWILGEPNLPFGQYLLDNDYQKHKLQGTSTIGTINTIGKYQRSPSHCKGKKRTSKQCPVPIGCRRYCITFSWDGSCCKYPQKIRQSQRENNLVRTVMYSPKSIARGSEGGERAAWGRETVSSDKYDIVNMIKGGWRKGSVTWKNPFMRRQSRRKMEAWSRGWPRSVNIGDPLVQSFAIISHSSYL